MFRKVVEQPKNTSEWKQHKILEHRFRLVMLLRHDTPPVIQCCDHIYRWETLQFSCLIYEFTDVKKLLIERLSSVALGTILCLSVHLLRSRLKSFNNRFLQALTALSGCKLLTLEISDLASSATMTSTTTFEWIARKLGTDIYVSLRMQRKNFDDPLTFL